MTAFAVVLLIVAAVTIVLGLVLYGNGVGAVPDEPLRERAATRQGLSRISWKDLFSQMKTSIKTITDADASRTQRLAATGAFCVMIGLIVVAIAVLAFVAALL
ncbi:hypothetical protein [Mycobacterium sp. IDR2000157661]|uniref:hypothetical protein n=1 Tax=Mycobacterium sp. IDR2000157661 TaxID=2867005 RepID=UPI001EED752A|nr:hypothetical protein [Mycobacterium sp. IDR2000157661]ULE35411.1 hypothetical protein K3G64_13170 [Mycobacterium sp. IDR2000157661]